MKDANSFRTAITRGGPSTPARWLVAHCKVPCGPETLDYGCGHGEDADAFKWDRYDPYYSPDQPTRRYNFIVCIYVLNTVTLRMQDEIIKRVKDQLSDNGVAFFAVRRDFPKSMVRRKAKKKKPTRQRYVELRMPVVRKNSNFCIYETRRIGDVNC